MSKLPDAEWRGWPGMDRLLEALDVREGKVRYVGGAVRDTLLGIAVTDVDCATALPPDQVLLRLEDAGIKAVPTGVAHGTVTAVLDRRPIEVTTLRRDVATYGRHADVEFTDDWREDAARRDFTINALSADPLTGELFDYFDGLADLAERRVRFIGDPLQRIAEDHLRILRFFRFHARFGSGGPDPDGLAAATARANDLMALSRERIADELLKMLALPDPTPTIALMIERRILAPMLPEIADAAALVQLVRREASLPGTPPDAIRRLAALLPADPEAADAVAARLKLSKAQRRRLAAAAEREPSDVDAPRALAYRFGAETALDRLLLADADEEAVRRAIYAVRADPPPRFPLKGGDLIAMGLPPGPVVASTLREIEEQWIAEDFPDEARVRAIVRHRIPSAPRRA